MYIDPVSTNYDDFYDSVFHGNYWFKCQGNIDECISRQVEEEREQNIRTRIERDFGKLLRKNHEATIL